MSALTAQEEPKRGPKDGKLAMMQGQLAPLRNADPKQILERYLAEQSTREIAQEFGVTRSALNQWLLKTAESDWKEAQVLRALKRKEDAEDAIDTAPDALSLARARESLKAAQWDLERVFRRIYGSDVPVDQASRVSITLNLRGDSATNAVQHGENAGITIEAEKLKP